MHPKRIEDNIMKQPRPNFLKIVTLPVFAFCALSLVADENDWFVPLGPPPKAKQKRIAGGEGFPPLPLPVTPLRRSERKREPKPPTLIAKVVWGESATYTFDNGATTRIEDWNLVPGDLQHLLNAVRQRTQIHYDFKAINLAAFHPDPQRLPILYFSGNRTIRFSDHQLEKLRAHVLNGGMIIADTPAGSPYFHESFREAMRSAFPELALRVIPPDHPVFNIYYNVDRVRLPEHAASDRPYFEGLYVGSRIGVLISPYGLGVGWNNLDASRIPKAVYYDVASAKKLGTNLVAYAIGYANTALVEARPEFFGTVDEVAPTDEFVFAQIRHEGAWNVHPGGASALLRRLRQSSALKVSLKREPVDPAREDLAPYTFLYLSGLDDFTFEPAAATRLRDFIHNNGTLVINNGLGLRGFDQAVRRELKTLLPDAELEPLAPDHPLYSTMFPVTKAEYTPAVRDEYPELAVPYLEGIHLNGELRVIYSPIDLAAGWQGSDYPAAKAYLTATAIPLGMNIILYAATH